MFGVKSKYREENNKIKNKTKFEHTDQDLAKISHVITPDKMKKGGRTRYNNVTG